MFRSFHRSIDIFDIATKRRLQYWAALELAKTKEGSILDPHSIMEEDAANNHDSTLWASFVLDSVFDLDSKWNGKVSQLSISTMESETASSTTEKAEQASPPAVEFSRIHEIAFIIAVCMAQFLSLAALAQTVAPLLIIGQSFGVTNPGQLSWYTASYSLTVGTFILPAGRLGDMYGHKNIFLLGWVWFAIWSLVTGFSYAAPASGGSMMLSVCRAFQGIGPALCVPNAMALIGRTFPVGMKRNVVLSCFAACGAPGFIVGAIFSSALARFAWWPWAFWVLAIVCLIIACLSFLVIPNAPRSAALQTPPSSQQKPTFDFLGCATGVSGLVLVNFALNQAPIVGWQTPYIPSLLAVGLLLTTAFIYIELYVVQHPLIPLRGLHVDAIFALACIAAGWGSHGIWIYYLYLFLEKIRGFSALAACAQTFPVAIIGATAAISTGFLLKKLRVAYVMFLAMFFFLIGTVLIATAPAGQTYWAQTFLSVLVMPFGMNWSFPAATILLSNGLPKERQGVAASLVSTVVNYSISCGLGLAGSIDRNLGSEDLLRGYRGAWYFGIGLSGLGFAISTYFVWKSRTP